MLEKLRSERGESIGEALAAMLIVALAALMLAGMTTAATRIVEKSEKAYNVYLDQRNYLESGGASEIPKNDPDGESSIATPVPVEGTLHMSGTGIAAAAYEPVTATILKSGDRTVRITYRYQKGRITIQEQDNNSEAE